MKTDLDFVCFSKKKVRMVDCLSHLLGFLNGIKQWFVEVGVYLYASLRFHNQNQFVCSMRVLLEMRKEQRQKFVFAWSEQVRSQAASGHLHEGGLDEGGFIFAFEAFEGFKAFEGEGSNEKFNEHFRALTGLHNASNNQMLKQSCNQLPDAITRSRIFCDHLSQCAMVVRMLQGLRNARHKPRRDTKLQPSTTPQPNMTPFFRGGRHSALRTLIKTQNT